MDKMRIKFPNNNEEIEFEYGKPVVVIGANGAGKTRFSVKIEEMNDPAFSSSHQFEKSHIHRLSAQKSLTISTSIPIYDYDSSKRNLFFGGSEEYVYKNGSRFQHQPVTSMLNDYQHALSLLFAEAQKELQNEHNTAKRCIEEGKSIPAPSETVVDKAKRIWDTLLPHRTIDLSGNGVHVNYNAEKYHGKEMSDGERVMLYMICQALVVKPHTLFIIDEPELHIHKAVMKELWTLLENERPDCVFMYLTHDIDFAVSRNNAQFLWIKSYNGHSWEYEFLDMDGYPDLPCDLLLEVLGTRQKIVFVEGTKDSYDYKLFHEVFRDQGYHVIPCGGCQDVIRLVKAKKTYEKLQPIEVYGIIDRDFRVDREISALEKDGIYSLRVAEVENLFVVPEVLTIMEKQLGCDAGVAETAKQFIENLFNTLKATQIVEALSREITHQCSLFEIGDREYTDEEIHDMIENRFTVENISAWRVEKEAIYNSASTLPEILAVFNYKELVAKISSKFSLSDRDFPKRVLNVLMTNKVVRVELLSALSSYIPQLP